MNSGLRMSGQNGPRTLPRGPAASSAAACFCASLMCSSGILGMRSGRTEYVISRIGGGGG